MTELLAHLESQAIEKIRDAFSQDCKVALFISQGLASDVLRHLVRVAQFTFSMPLSIVHLDEGSEFAHLTEFLDRIRSEETAELVVKSTREMVLKDKHFANIPHEQLCNFVLKDLVESGGYGVLVTGLQWNRDHPWLSHEIVFRSSQVQRVEPLGNWTRRDLENYAADRVRGYEKPMVRVS